MNERRRQSRRLPGYDYSSAGIYFVTLVTYGRDSLFGEVRDGQAAVSEAGRIVAEEWLRSADIRLEVRLDAFVVMPNHLHGIIVVERNLVGAHGRAPLRATPLPAPHRKPRSLGSFIAGFKAARTKRINELRRSPGQPVWQRNYYEHIVRSDAELDRIRRYIAANPARWDEDRENLAVHLSS